MRSTKAVDSEYKTYKYLYIVILQLLIVKLKLARCIRKFRKRLVTYNLTHNATVKRGL